MSAEPFHHDSLYEQQLVLNDLYSDGYIGATLDKSVRESFYKRAAIDDAYLADEELHYAARDAYIMLPIWRQQLPELKKHKLMQVAEEAMKEHVRRSGELIAAWFARQQEALTRT